MKIYDPTKNDSLGQFRGGGRIIQMLRENLETEAEFVADFNLVNQDDTLLVPFWKPFEAPILEKMIAKRQILIIFDVIPLKYPSHFPPGIKGKLNLWRNKQALKNYDRIITISEHSRDDIIQHLGIGDDKIAVVYPTYTNSFASSKTAEKKTSTAPYCLYVGDANWNKNLVNLARAIKIADVKCLFVGKGFKNLEHDHEAMGHPELAELRQFLHEVQGDERFVFKGYVSDEELAGLYHEARCNLLISRDEGFGLSYLEAATQKCPSVLSDIKVLREIGDDSAIFADPEDPAKIALGIKKYFSDIALREKMGNLAFSHSKKFSPKIFGDKILATISSL